MEFKDRLRALRKSKKMTQQRLAKILGYGYTAISNYESGRNEPAIKDLVRLANFFNVSLDYLMANSKLDNFVYDWNIGECIVSQNTKETYYVQNIKVINSIEGVPTQILYILNNNRYLSI